MCGCVRCVVTGVDIAERLGHLVQQRVHKSKRWFAGSETFVIDKGEDASCGGAGAGGRAAGTESGHLSRTDHAYALGSDVEGA